MKQSWNQAVLDALSARKNFENDEQRCDKLLYDYTDKPKPKPTTETTKRKSTAKRKSLIPNRKRSANIRSIPWILIIKFVDKAF